MQRDERDLLETLKAELEFLNSGGYARVPNSSWRPIYVFEDSPACMYRDYEVNPGGCSDCVLLQLVPWEFRAVKHPCRHIPLNAHGETLDLLYRYADGREIEEKVRYWLEATIGKLEENRTSLQQSNPVAAPDEAGRSAAALHENAKCANPACPVAFDWRKGGKFFRFRQNPGATGQTGENQPPSGIHGVKHYWLCDRCSHLFTLAYEEHAGVVLKVSPRDCAVAQDERLSAA